MINLTSCSKNDQNNPDDPTTSGLNYTQGDSGDLVYEDEESEWYVHIFKTGMVYDQASKVVLPDPWYIPSREEGQILRTIPYGDGKWRFVTNDGYTFGMPSASVSKAGAKKEYAVLGLRKRIKVIVVSF